MKCLIDGNNARILAKAVQSLSKFGAELFVEADEDGLLLRSINASRSAVGSFKFNRSFFNRFHVEPSVVNYCKITSKSCFNVFRNMKQVEHCEINICVSELQFQLEVKCKYEQTKKVIISIIDEENISAAVNNENLPNLISASHKIFNEISSNFNALEEEITVEAKIGSLVVKNFIEGARVNDKFMRSQLKFLPTELEKYRIRQPTSITFCLKEFRAYLAFAEAVNENIILQFSEAGSPLFLRINKSDILECILIMSTLSPEDIEYCDDCNQNETLKNNSLNQSSAQKRKTRSSNTNKIDEPQSKRHSLANESTLSNDTELFNFDAVDSDGLNNLNEIDRIRNVEVANIDSGQKNLEGQRVPESVEMSSNMSVLFYDTENQKCSEIDDVINQTQTKTARLRTIFSRCFEPTFVLDEPTSSSEVYAPDSDTD